MAHIHTEPGQHDLTVSAFIVRDGRLLLHRHKRMGVLMQPGGHVELAEDPWQALAHEIAEETGYRLSQLHVLQPRERLCKLSGARVHPYPICVTTHEVTGLPGHFHTDLVYALTTEEEPHEAPAPGESSALVWVSRAELMDLPPEDVFTNVREIGCYVFDTVLVEWEPIRARR